VRRFIFLLILSLQCFSQAIAQSPNGTINGIVLDPSGAAIPGAEVVVINDGTGAQYTTRANGMGIYVVSNLPPGPYRIQVSNSGFKTIIKPDIVVHVQDAIAINFTLPIGSASEIVTVQGGAPLINTENATLSTVVDRTFVENTPLNGRSFQNLILLAPGVVTNSPQVAAGNGNSGEFSVNGQRAESNYYTVDGVSADVGVSPGGANTPSPAGSLPASTALGTTHALVSVDALQEFRVQSSTYSAEYGRSPGGQFSFVTRPGTNQWHGTAFDYLRNNVFDANDWFNDYLGKPAPPLRQNDFGGTLGGPIWRDRTFFFFSYEGLRLTQPQAATTTVVPTTLLRQSAPAALLPLLDAFPLPNCPPSSSNCSNDLGNGLGQFVGTWSNPSSIDSTSIRLDHTINDKLRIFFRFSNTPSRADARSTSLPSVLTSTDFTIRTYTFGATSTLSTRMGNEFRLNYSSNQGIASATPTNFASAKSVNLFQLQGFTGAINQDVEFDLAFGSFFNVLFQNSRSTEQQQWGVMDTYALSCGSHQLKFGIDFRRPRASIFAASPSATYLFLSEASVQSNNADLIFGASAVPVFPIYANFSAFAQDEWRLTPRLNLSMGLRWEVNPAPGDAKGKVPYTVQGSSLNTLTLAPRGSELWNTTWYNFAPRLGLAYILRNATDWQTVVRGGGGVYFDTGQQLGSFGYQGPGFSADNILSGAFPAPVPQVNPPITNPPTPPYSSMWAFSPHLQLPYTLQSNVTIQQALGKTQALTISYVGARGRRLLEFNQVNVSKFNPNFSVVTFAENALTSDYDALQIQFQRRLGQGLQALGSYTWGHSIDFGSQNNSLPSTRGNSDFDVRHNLSTALSYDVPNHFHGGLAGALLEHWGVDDRFVARTAFPVTLNGTESVDPTTGQTFFGGLNLVPGQPTYIYGFDCAAVYNNGRGCPGGRAINPQAFSKPASGLIGDAPRNFARGFGAWQMDLAARREFPIYERLKLQFRAEVFNIFNHPNFGRINPIFCSPGPGCTFGQATATLANSLGGLASLYQMGGPRSMQFALKFIY
jgi:hypothetical protein